MQFKPNGELVEDTRKEETDLNHNVVNSLQVYVDKINNNFFAANFFFFLKLSSHSRKIYKFIIAQVKGICSRYFPVKTF